MCHYNSAFSSVYKTVFTFRFLVLLQTATASIFALVQINQCYIHIHSNYSAAIVADFSQHTRIILLKYEIGHSIVRSCLVHKHILLRPSNKCVNILFIS